VFSKYYRPDKMHAWLGCNVYAQKERVGKKREAQGGRYCMNRVDVSVPLDFSFDIHRCSDWAFGLLPALSQVSETATAP
jgi:hypothetical protein